MSDREELNELTMRIAREHERAPWGCVCGAKFGDSIDAHWHLINVTRDATVELLAKHDADLLAPIRALVEKWEGIDAAISPMLDHPAQGSIKALAEQLAAVIDTPAQADDGEGAS